MTYQVDNDGYYQQRDEDVFACDDLDDEIAPRQIGDAVHRYKNAGQAKVGSKILCAWCARSMIKTTYHKRFCSNQKTTRRGKNSCKDRYWNEVNPRGQFSHLKEL